MTDRLQPAAPSLSEPAANPSPFQSLSFSDLGQFVKAGYVAKPVLPARFAAKTVVDSTTGCWLWQGSTCGLPGYLYGYIRMGFGFEHRTTAHRFAYWITRGSIPRGLEIDHLCCNKLCVNPSHLEAVTHRENITRINVEARMADRQRLWAFDCEPLRAMYRRGMSLKQIAAETGIRYLYVWRAINGRTKKREAL